MKIIKTNEVNSRIIDELVYVLNICKDFDGSYKEPYLANTYNYDLDMPWLFLAKEHDRYLGFLSIYADSLDEAEIALYVLPEYRNEGIARKLFRKSLETIKKYNIKEISFITEKLFLDRYPNLLGVWNTKLDPESEYLMILEGAKDKVEPDERFDVVLANDSYIDQVAAFQAEAFEESLEVARNYVSQSILDDSTRIYIILDRKSNQVLGSTSVEVSSDYNYLFGLAMHKDFRGKGIATYFIQSVLETLDSFNGKPYQLSVDKSNTIAKNFYDKLNFKVLTEVMYLNVDTSSIKISLINDN